MGQRIALTGATGFAGQHILTRLVSAHCEVRALVRNPAAAKLAENVELITGALNDKAALQDLVEGTDCVVHVAGAISGRNREEFFEANVEGTRNILSAASMAGVRRFIYVSSLAARQPALSHYAASKAAAEALVRIANISEVLILRPCAIYGEGDQATLPLMKQLLRRIAIIPGRAKSRFSFLHVTDFASIIASAVAGHETGVREVDDGEGGHDWNSLAASCRTNFGTPKRIWFIPRAVVAMVGLLGEGLAGVLARPPMLTRGKVNELYHSDWVAAGPGWPRSDAVPLADGLYRTIVWYQQRGLLPQKPQKK